ncbi:MAG: alanine dehydrogenase, partial [Candidatus Hydrothermarchaeales archaeon]
LNSDEIKTVLDIDDVILAVEKAFEQHGLDKVQMPPKSYLYFERYNGDLRTMPAYIEALEMAGAKIVNSHPGNPSKGIPTVMAVVILNDPKTGAPLAVMDGTHLTDMRTGAAGAVACKYLAREDSKVVGLVGAGRQARTQLLAISKVFELEKAMIVSMSLEGSNRFKKEMEGVVGIDIVVKEGIEEVCDSDILVTATPVREPIVREEWIGEGMHINAIGADAEGKEELEPEVLKKAKVVIDDLLQAVHSGEINVPLSKGIITKDDIYASLGEVVAGKIPGRTSEEGITVFDSTGLAIQDIAAGKLAYEKALEAGVGQRLKLF